VITDDRQYRTQTRILDAAENLFRRFSFLGLRMRQIADHVGLSRKTLYNHFPGGKREIWTRCVERRMEEFARRLVDLVGDTRRDYVDRARDILDIGREAVEVFYGPRGMLATHEDEQMVFPELRQRYVDALTRFFQEGTERGYLRPGLPIRSLALSLVVLIAEWGRPGAFLDSGEVKSLPEFVETVLFDGILSDRGRRNVHRLHGGSNE